MNSSTHLLSRYLDHCRFERGLSENTLSAYEHDLLRYAEGLESLGSDLLAVDIRGLEKVMLLLSQAGLSVRSQSRAVSVIRGLHAWLAADQVLHAAPLADTAVKVKPQLRHAAHLAVPGQLGAQETRRFVEGLPGVTGLFAGITAKHRKVDLCVSEVPADVNAGNTDHPHTGITYFLLDQPRQLPLEVIRHTLGAAVFFCHVSSAPMISPPTGSGRSP